MERTATYNARDFSMNLNEDEIRGFLAHYAYSYKVKGPDYADINVYGDSSQKMVTSEPKMEITLGMRQLEDLINIDKLYHRDMDEAEIRMKIPAAQKAWDHYRTIMGLVN